MHSDRARPHEVYVPHGGDNLRPRPDVIEPVRYDPIVILLTLGIFLLCSLYVFGLKRYLISGTHTRTTAR